MDPGQPAPSAQEAPASYIAIHPDGSRSVIPSSPAAVVDGAWQMERALGDFNASEYGFEYASLKHGDVVCFQVPFARQWLRGCNASRCEAGAVRLTRGRPQVAGGSPEVPACASPWQGALATAQGGC